MAYVEGDSVLFRLQAQIQPEQLQRVIALRGKLELLAQALPLQSGLPPAELVYRWNP